MSTKTCPKCGVEKDFSEFGRNNTAKDGLQFWCKLCRKEHREANREKISARRKEYHKANREKVIAKLKEHYKANREEILAKMKEYREDNRDKISVRKKEYHEANREKILAKNRTPEARVKANSRRRERLASEPRYRMETLLRARLKKALKAQGAEKFTNTMNLIGCSPEFLTKHLEKQIKPGTKREDYHVDHIVPCAFFNLTNEEEQKMCFHWTNLQLLLGPANKSKSDDVFWSGQVYRPDEVPPEIREEIYAYCRSKITSRSS
jgi:hypothetical protein